MANNDFSILYHGSFEHNCNVLHLCSNKNRAELPVGLSYFVYFRDLVCVLNEHLLRF